MRLARNTDKNEITAGTQASGSFTLRDSASRLGILKILRQLLRILTIPSYFSSRGSREKSLNSMHLNIAATN